MSSCKARKRKFVCTPLPLQPTGAVRTFQPSALLPQAATHAIVNAAPAALAICTAHLASLVAAPLNLFTGPQVAVQCCALHGQHVESSHLNLATEPLLPLPATCSHARRWPSSTTRAAWAACATCYPTSRYPCCRCSPAPGLTRRSRTRSARG